MNFRDSFLLLLLALWLGGISSCGYIHDDIEPCPTGIDLVFRYDYNLQRADMFSDHVGSVTVYLFDEEGKFLCKKEESNASLNQPLQDKNYNPASTTMWWKLSKFLMNRLSKTEVPILSVPSRDWAI